MNKYQQMFLGVFIFNIIAVTLTYDVFRGISVASAMIVGMAFGVLIKGED